MTFNNLLAVAENTIDIVKYITIGVIALLLILVLVLSTTKNKFNTKSIVYASICIATSFGLSFIKYTMPFGGSITLASLVPLFFYAYVFGSRKGLLAGIVYGLLQFIQDSWFLTPVQFLLDYILAFSTIALAPVFKHIIKNKLANVTLGITVVCFARLLMHLFSGIIFFNAGMVSELLPQANSFVYSLCYNAFYIVPDLILCIAVLIYLVLSKTFDRLETTLLNSAK